MDHEPAVQAISAMERHMDTTERLLCAFAGMLAGKLRAFDIDSAVLKQFKNELQDFDGTRKVWKARKEL